MTEEILKSLLGYINSFWSAEDLVIKGSAPHFINGKTKRTPIDINIMFLGARDHSTIEKKWNNFISHFEIDKMVSETTFYKIYDIKFENESIRVEIDFQDNLPRDFVEIIPGFPKLYAPKYEYWILSKIHSISYYMSNGDSDEKRFKTIINDLQNVKKEDIPKIIEQINSYLEFALNNKGLISFNSYLVNLDSDFLNQKEVIKRIQKDILNKPIAQELVGAFLEKIKQDIFKDRIEALGHIYNIKSYIKNPTLGHKEIWHITNNVIRFDDVSTLLKVVNEIVNEYYANIKLENYLENVDLTLLKTSSWNLDNIFLSYKFKLGVSDDVKYIAKNNLLPLKESDYNYDKNTIILPVKYENNEYHLLINNFYYLIILLYTYKEAEDDWMTTKIHA